MRWTIAIPALDVEVEDPGVVDEDRERPVGEVASRLPQDLKRQPEVVENCSPRRSVKLGQREMPTTAL